MENSVLQDEKNERLTVVLQALAAKLAALGRGYKSLEWAVIHDDMMTMVTI